MNKLIYKTRQLGYCSLKFCEIFVVTAWCVWYFRIEKHIPMTVFTWFRAKATQNTLGSVQTQATHIQGKLTHSLKIRPHKSYSYPLSDTKTMTNVEFIKSLLEIGYSPDFFLTGMDFSSHETRMWRQRRVQYITVPKSDDSEGLWVDCRRCFVFYFVSHALTVF